MVGIITRLLYKLTVHLFIYNYYCYILHIVDTAIVGLSVRACACARVCACVCVCVCICV